jgi:hypothetical protein
MPINSFPLLVSMYSLYHFSSQGGYHLVTFKLRGQARERVIRSPLWVTNRLRTSYAPFDLRCSTLVARSGHLPESTTCDRMNPYLAASA